jgi:hypothetical protein
LDRFLFLVLSGLIVLQIVHVVVQTALCMNAHGIRCGVSIPGEDRLEDRLVPFQQG